MRRLLTAAAVLASVTAATGLGAPLAATASAATASAATASAATASAATASRSASTALAALTPSGPVAGSACTTSGSTTACHVYAVAGSVALPGQVNPVPAWKFRASGAAVAAGQLTGTGPVLVVPAGNAVTLTLDNANVGSNVSLAVPGIAGLPDDTTGVAAGAGRDYTFTPTRPGTYLYEAGHTPNGAREVLMGLVGALVVRPSDWTPSGGTSDLGQSSTPASGFDDEAVLVLGDVDPAFAAAPLTYDLRQFHGTYRTINGAAYPGTDQIPTAVGRTVLLRYLDAGAVNHSMGVLGLRQKVIAATAYPGTGQSLVADMLSPGQTEDVLVTISAEGNYVVGDSGGALDTAGLSDGSGGLAFGGMMTLLGTDVTPPSADAIGPRSTVTGVSPNPAKVTTPVTVTASFADPRVSSATGPSDVQAAELLVDGQVTSLAPGSGLPFALAAGPAGSGTATGTLTLGSGALGALAQGQHRLYVRAQDSVGNWGPVASTVLTLAVTGPATSGAVASPNPTNGAAALTVSATGDDSALGGTVDAARFAVDCDPGAPASTCTTTPMSVTSPAATVSALTGSLPATSVIALGEGSHTVYVQSHDALSSGGGFWGPSASTALTVDLTAPTGSALAVSPSPTDGTVGDPVDPASLKVSGTFTDVATGKPASAVVAAEGVFPPLSGTTQAAPTAADNGKGFVFVAADGAFGSTTENAYGTVPLSTLTAYPNGTYQIWMHAKDAAGNWGAWAPASVTVQRGLFADGFETAAGQAALAPWTGGVVTGGGTNRLTVTAAAANTGTQGLVIAGAVRAQATATLGTPAVSPAATGYHARFAVNPNNVATYTQGGTVARPTYTAGRTALLTGMSGTTEAFQVQYQRTTPTANAQVRLYFPATGAATGWTTINRTAWSSIKVDWATGTKATLTITVNGTAASLTGRNTSALKITGARLGFLDSTQNVVGTAYADAFASSLNPLP